MQDTQLIQSLLRDISEETKNTITQLKSDISNAYTSISDKGGTLPEEQNAGNLAAAIESIPSGADPDEVDLTKWATNEKIENVYIKDATWSKQALPTSWQKIGTIHMNDVVSVTVPSILNAITVDKIEANNLKTTPNDFGTRLNLSGVDGYALSFPELTAFGMWFLQYTNAHEVSIPKAPLNSIFYNYIAMGNATDLIKIETGAAATGSFSLAAWNPTNALKSDSTSLVDSGETFTSNLEKFLYNIRTYLAANLSPSVTATITFSANVYNAIQADPTTVAAFPASWTIASA